MGLNGGACSARTVAFNFGRAFLASNLPSASSSSTPEAESNEKRPGATGRSTRKICSCPINKAAVPREPKDCPDIAQSRARRAQWSSPEPPLVRSEVACVHRWKLFALAASRATVRLDIAAEDLDLTIDRTCNSGRRVGVRVELLGYDGVGVPTTCGTLFPQFQSCPARSSPDGALTFRRCNGYGSCTLYDSRQSVTSH